MREEMTMRGSEYKKLNEISFLMGLVRGITVCARIYMYIVTFFICAFTRERNANKLEMWEINLNDDARVALN